MSKLEGHKKITLQAVNEIKDNCKQHSIGGNLDVAYLAEFTVSRDVIDVFTIGHWSNFAQKHHFMRRFEQQTERAAYMESIEWISSNALTAAGHLAWRIHFFKERGMSDKANSKPNASCGLKSMPQGAHMNSVGREVLGEDYFDDEPNDADWQAIGNAIHALQDSFSEGHTMRSNEISTTKAGKIIRVKRYSGIDKIGHSKHDQAWGQGDTFTFVGKQAVNATKDLISMIINTALTSKQGEKPTKLISWDDLKRKWLVASPTL